MSGAAGLRMPNDGAPSRNAGGSEAADQGAFVREEPEILRAACYS
jgi:hypothetical protein